MNETKFDNDILRSKGFTEQPDGTWLKPKAGSVAVSAVTQPDTGDEFLAEASGKNAHKIRCLVCVTSFRRKLTDDDNLHGKHFVDALTEAGILVDDSQVWAELKILQVKIGSMDAEKTTIEITPLP